MSVGLDVNTASVHGFLISRLSRPRDLERVLALINREWGGLLWIDLVAEKRSGKTGLFVPQDIAPKLLAQKNYLANGADHTLFSLLARVLPREQEHHSGWAKALTENLPVPTVKYIADVRRTSSNPLSVDQLRGLTHASARLPSGGRREAWTETLGAILKDVFGPSTEYAAMPSQDGDPSRDQLLISLDGQADVPLDHVGAGVREVVAIAHAALTGGTANVICVEEPENCLHPKAVRRMLRSVTDRTGSQLFVSTHSAAVVDARPDAVIQLSRTGGETIANSVTRPTQHFEVIRALGHSPAELVLTPCVLWVEGPSDRLYFRTWLAAHNIFEGVHYQTMFYAGSLGAHVTLAADVDPDEVMAAVRRLSRRCVLVADSDRGTADQKVKPHVARFQEELADDDHALLVVTPGREVENYIPRELANKVRADHGLPELPAGGASYRFRRVLSPTDGRALTKVKFATAVLAELAGSIPTAATEDLACVASFIADAESYD